MGSSPHSVCLFVFRESILFVCCASVLSGRLVFTMCPSPLVSAVAPPRAARAALTDCMG